MTKLKLPTPLNLTALLAQARDGWTVHGVTFPPESERAEWLPGRHKRKHAPCGPMPPCLTGSGKRSSPPETEARRTRMLEIAAEMAPAGSKLSIAALAKQMGMNYNSAYFDMLALKNAGRWRHRPCTPRVPGQRQRAKGVAS